MGKKYNCEIVDDEIICTDADGKVKKIGYTTQNKFEIKDMAKSSRKSISIGFPSFYFFTYVIGAIVYQNLMVNDYGSPIANFFMAGLFFLFFTLLLWLVFFANAFAGIWVFAQQDVWQSNLLNFVGLSDKTLLSEIYYGIVKWIGIVVHVILIIVIIILIILAIRALVNALSRREKKEDMD